MASLERIYGEASFLRDLRHILKGAPSVSVFSTSATAELIMLRADWQYEEAAERTRQQSLQSHHGIRLVISSIFEGTRVWLVLGLTGLGVGFIGAYLDILVAWLSDLRAGRCTYGFFYNEVACCSGLNGKIASLFLGAAY